MKEFKKNNKFWEICIEGKIWYVHNHPKKELELIRSSKFPKFIAREKPCIDDKKHWFDLSLLLKSLDSMNNV